MKRNGNFGENNENLPEFLRSLQDFGLERVSFRERPLEKHQFV